MIIFDQQLEQWVQKSAKNHVYVEREKKIPASAYFLLGSFCSDGDYHVAHVSKCPVHATALTEEADEKTKLLDDEWMADNAERVLRVLPGGVDVIGIAWFSSKGVYLENKNIITRTLARVQRMNNALTTMGLDASISDTMVCAFFETSSENPKPVGTILDVVGRQPDSTTKVVFQKLEWISVVTNASARIVLNVPPRTGQKSDFYNDFVAASKQFTTNLFKCNLVLLDGAIREDSEPLFKDLKKNKKSSVEAQLFIDPLFNRSNECAENITTNLHEILFDIEIRAAIPSRSLVRDAKKSLKHHLIRNLCSRAELHYESMEIVEEVSTTACSVHQLPRPATTVLHCHPAILLNEFLFEADNIEDAQKNFDDMMDLQTSIEHVDEGWERALTPEEMEAVRMPLEDLRFVDFEQQNESCCTTRTLLITVAIIVGIIASLIYFIVSSASS